MAANRSSHSGHRAARRGRRSPLLRLGLAVAAVSFLCSAAAAGMPALSLAAAAPLSSAAAPARGEESMQVSAFLMMQKYMKKYDKDGFSEVVHVGDLVGYRQRLLSTEIVIDPSLKPAKPGDPPPLALYDPVKRVLAFLKDPRTLTDADERSAFGQTVWHEVTQAIEDDHGDDFSRDDVNYAERHVAYMTLVFGKAVGRLNEMEKKAKAGASVKKIREYWTRFLGDMEQARELPETEAYPPDLDEMRAWFGFRANPSEIRELYLKNKAFAGRK
jgi:hypothetical protein